MEFDYVSSYHTSVEFNFKYLKITDSSYIIK